MQAPFIISIVAPTGTGKTHNAATLLQHFKNGTIPLVHRFNSTNASQGDPYNLKRVHYIGVKADNSYDTTHNENVTRILTSGMENDGEAKTLEEMAADAHIEAKKDFGLLKMPKPASLIPDYIKGIKEKDVCIVIDDMSAFLDDFSQQAQTDLKTLFQAGSHHEGLSLVFIYQTVPKGQLGGTLFRSSHYIMFPVPQFSSETGLGVLVGDFRTIMHMVAGFSKDLLEQFTNLIKSTNDKPNFILFNKMNLKTDKELTSSKAMTSEPEVPIKASGNKKKS
jgi:hypothetical protein